MPRYTKQNKLTSEEEIAKIHPHNKRLMNEFLTYLKSVQRSDGTIRGYKNDLEIFFCWNLRENDNKHFNKVSKRDFVLFQGWLLSNGNSPSRVRRIKSTISSLSNYIEAILDEEEEFKQFKPTIRKIESPVNQPVREKTVFETDELDRLLDHLVEKGCIQQACVLALAMASGCRKTELLRFKTWYLDDKNIVLSGAAYKTPEPIKTKGFGNGKYINKYVLRKDYDKYFKMWIDHRSRIKTEHDFLFIKSDGNPLVVSTLDSWALAFSKFLGKPFYWHSLRHYFTTFLSKAGLPSEAIRIVIGWSSTSMVQVYDDTPADDRIEKYFDESGIKTDVSITLNDL